MALLSLFLFGSPRIELDNRTVSMDRSKAVALLAYLAVSNTSHSREALATLFWPEYDQSRAFAYLRRTLWSINNTLGEGWIETGREAVDLNKGSGFYLDIEHFHSLLEATKNHKHADPQTCVECIESLKQAATLYKDDFLAGFSLRDSADFDDWQMFQAESMRHDFKNVLERLALNSLSAGDYEAVIQYTRRWLALDPFQEEAHRLLIETYAKTGDRSAALRQYQECSRLLSEELGVSPQEEIQELYRLVKDGKLSQRKPLPSTVSTPEASLRSAAAPARLISLPTPATPFIGRQAELQEISSLLQNPECRLLTLFGPGGTGKTRLSIRAAELSKDWEGAFASGIYFVSLAPINSDEDLLPTIAEVIRLSFSSEQRHDLPRQDPETQFLDFLRRKELLLVLDNFEHLMDGSQLLAKILENAPGVKILVTSRERLNLYGEWVLEIPGMDMPPEETASSETDLEGYAAVELFIKNARRVHTSFRAGKNDLETIARICRMVEGMPLAIELASAWVKMLPVQEISREISKNLDFLSSSVRNMPQRHSSLRVVFEHSWNLLTEAEKNCLIRLSVFRGSFGREAAQVIANGSLAMLSVLVDKSLLHRNSNSQDSGVRYEMHELVKQYATEKLASTENLKEQTLNQHARYFTALLAKHELSLRGENQLPGVERLDKDFEDIRAAWNRALDQAMLTELKQSSFSLIAYLDIKGRLREVKDLMEKGVSRLRNLRVEGLQGEEVDGLYATFLAGFALFYSWVHIERNFALVQESLEIMEKLEHPEDWAQVYLMLNFGSGVLNDEHVFDRYQRTVEIFDQQGNRWGIAAAQLIFGDYCREISADTHLTLELWKKALDGFSRLGDKFSMANCLNALANVSYETGNYAEASLMAEESLSIYRLLGDRWRVVGALITLGQVKTALGAYQEAGKHYHQGLEISQEIGNVFLMATLLDCLGYTCFVQEDYQNAQAHYQQALSFYEEGNRIQGLGMAYTNLGDIARAQNKIEKARRLYQQALDEFNKIPVLNVYEQWGIAIANKKLGLVYLLEGRYVEAREKLSLALEKSWEIERTPEILDIMVGVADLQARQGNLETGLEILALITNHQATPKEAYLRAESLLSELASELPSDLVNKALLQGKNSLLEETILQFLPDKTSLE